VCYKCHATQNFAGSPPVNRVLGTNDVSDDFASSNASFHPVQTTGRNTDVPSLLTAYTVTSIIYCTDCHNSNDSTVKGPHGSAYSSLLKANYTTDDNTAESSQAYALCYSCHSRTSILEDRSFKRHHQHISDVKASCATCHDPHGVATNTNLINFDRDVVLPANNGMGPTFTDTGARHGTCTLKCHGRNHDNLAY
jgi:hypothetical protein